LGPEGEEFGISQAGDFVLGLMDFQSAFSWGHHQVWLLGSWMEIVLFSGHWSKDSFPRNLYNRTLVCPHDVIAGFPWLSKKEQEGSHNALYQTQKSLSTISATFHSLEVSH
jgi:hypothetical protein